jgi:lysophospholipid acyltransferase (LPLAT)-like uncharacterized protein
MQTKPRPAPFFLTLAGRIVGWWTLFAAWTTRWEEINKAAVLGVYASGAPMIAAIWHGRTLMGFRNWACDPSAPPVHALISKSKDGEMVAAALAAQGVDNVRGSTDKPGKSKGGFAAMRDILKLLQSRVVVCVTPDGPKGPRQRVSDGIIQIAKLSGAPIVVFAWSKRNAVRLSSWDRMLAPLPFGRGVLIWGGPIRVPRDASPEETETIRQRLEDELNRLTAEADARVGRAVVAPAAQARPGREEEAPA